MLATVDTLVIGAGQAGLATGYHLRRAGRSFTILDAAAQPGGSWPQYYDSLRLFSPARFSSLPGLRFPGDPERYPTRDEVIAYLRQYAEHFQLPILSNAYVAQVARDGELFTVQTDDGRTFQARSMIAATGAFHRPYLPQISGQDTFRGSVLHAFAYRDPAPFCDQRVVVVGAGNSAVQIATELAQVAQVTLATREQVRFVNQRPYGRDIHFWWWLTRFDTRPLDSPLGMWLNRLASGKGPRVLDTGIYRAALASGEPDRRPMFIGFTDSGIIWNDGSGHSAFNAILDLAALAELAPDTSITWIVRRGEMGQAYGGGRNDALPARGALGQRIRALVERGVVQLITGWRTDRLERTPDGIVAFAGDQSLQPVDEIIVATGLRPDLAMLGELRLSLDPAVDAPTTLAPLIDPNIHSCGTVPPHGADELAHPEPDFYMIGMKSYGRAPTFLMLTGYEQARSVVAALAGDWEAARRVELTLPETGVCSGPVAAGGGVASSCCGPALAAPVGGANLIALTPVGAGVAVSARNSDLILVDSQAGDVAATGCCGGPAPAGADACCVKDADAKAAGQDGCGCGTSVVTSSEPVAAGGGCCG